MTSTSWKNCPLFSKQARTQQGSHAAYEANN
jgi:hypothetical protein